MTEMIRQLSPSKCVKDHLIIVSILAFSLRHSDYGRR